MIKNLKRVLHFLKWILIILAFLIISTWILVSIFREDIQNRIIETLGSSADVEIQFATSDISFWRTFPGLSLEVTELKLKSTTQNSYWPETEAGQAYFSIRLPDLLHNEYIIRKITLLDADIRIPSKIIKKTGTTTRISETVPFHLELNDIQLENVKLHFINDDLTEDFSLQARLLDIQGRSGPENHHFHISGFVLPEFSDPDLGNILGGRVVESRLDISLGINLDELVVKQAELRLADIVLKVTGQLTKNDYRFVISTENTSIKKLKRIFDQYLTDINKHINYSGHVDFTGIISGRDNSGTPTIDISFEHNDNKLLFIREKIEFENISIAGRYSNLATASISDDKIEVRKFSMGNNYADITGDLSITNLESPEIKSKIHYNIEAEKLSAIHDSLPLKFRSGEIYGELHISRKRPDWGPLVAQDLIYSHSKGSAIFGGIEAEMIQNNHKWIIPSGKLYFNNNHLRVDSIELITGQSHINISGLVQNFFSALLMGELEKEMEIRASLHSKRLNIIDLLNIPFEEFTADTNTRSIPVKAGIVLNCDTLIYKTFFADSINGKLDYQDDQISIDFLDFNAWSGRINLDAKLNRNTDHIRYSCNSAVHDADISKMFIELDDFGQKDITHENIGGKIDANLFLQGLLTNDLSIVSDSVYVLADIHVKNGNLKNFSPIVNSLKLLNEDSLRDIKFESLNNTIEIRNSIIDIPDMEIRSNVLDFEGYGTHTFNNEIDYHVRILLSELFSNKAKSRSDEISKFGYIEDDGYGKTSLYFHLTGKASDPDFEYDTRAVRKKFKADFIRERNHAIKAFKEEFPWLVRDSVAKDRAERKKKWIRQQEQGEFLFEWEEDTLNTEPRK